MDNFLAITKWEHWSFLGFLVTLVGVGLTVYFAKDASHNSRIAAEASADAKKAIATIDAISETSRVIELLKQLRIRLNSPGWDRISELCEELLVTVAKIGATKSVDVSESGAETIKKLEQEMRELAKQADEAVHGEDKIDVAKKKAVITTLLGSVSVLNTELKEAAN